MRSDIPFYGHRDGFVPRDSVHFAEGGAFPEIHVAQYPFGGGPTSSMPGAAADITSTRIGDATFGGIMTVDTTSNNVIQTKHADVLPASLNVSEAGAELLRKPKFTLYLISLNSDTTRLVMLFSFQIIDRPPDDITQITLAKTRDVILGRIEKKSGVEQLPVPSAGAVPEYIKYTPSKQSAQYNSGASHRLIKMHEVQHDPLEPPKFRHKKVGMMASDGVLSSPSFIYLSLTKGFSPRRLQVPQGPCSPPVPVMHSPPRSITAKDQTSWKIPPSISNWKVRSLLRKYSACLNLARVGDKPSSFLLVLVPAERERVHHPSRQTARCRWKGSSRGSHQR